MISYLKLVRIPNLLIVGFLQLLLYYGILIPRFEKNHISPTLDGIYFVLLVIATIFITASGYVINDYLDIKIDKLNKPEKLIVTKEISKKNTLIFYWVIFAVGFIISLVIAIHINKIHYIILYLLSFLFLYFYSSYLKRKLLVGNVFVSAFSSFVLGIILLFEYPGLQKLKLVNSEDYIISIDIFIGFMIFSFFVSLYREIVKDIEDAKGDKIANANTIPIFFGVEVSKTICGMISIIVLALLFLWLKLDFNTGNLYLVIYMVLFVMLPLFYSVYLLKNASFKKDFNRLSGFIKLIMLSGIFLLFFYI